MAYAVGALLETVYSAGKLNGEPPMTRFLAQHLGSSHHYSVARAQRDFDYTPLVTVEEGLRRLEPELKKLAGAR